MNATVHLERHIAGDQTPTAKQIEAALIQVRDTHQTVSLAPFTFRHAKERGIDFCYIEMNWIGRDVFLGTDHGPTNRSSFSGFGFGCIALKRVAASLAKEAFR